VSNGSDRAPAGNSVELATKHLDLPDPREDEWKLTVEGCRVERVTLEPEAEFEYRWSGKFHYLAWHSLHLLDGEAVCGNQEHSLRRDLRGALTFVPAGESIAGWSRLNSKPQSFLALYIDPQNIDEGLRERFDEIDLSPKLYFESAALRQTLEKINHALSLPDQIDSLYLQYLTSISLLELCRDFGVKDKCGIGAKLPRHHQIRLIEFIEANLHADFNLDDLAAITGHSRFHFLRLFKESFGYTPFQFVLKSRIERAKEYLINGQSIDDTYAAVGFKSKVLFARAFKRVTGFTPFVFMRM
jgi:AraC-like DNA-binding protein